MQLNNKRKVAVTADSLLNGIKIHNSPAGTSKTTLK